MTGLNEIALPITPEFLHHIFNFLGMLAWCQLATALGSKLGCIHLSKLLQGEGPTMKSRAEANRTNDGVNLKTKLTCKNAAIHLDSYVKQF